MVPVVAIIWPGHDWTHRTQMDRLGALSWPRVALSAVGPLTAKRTTKRKIARAQRIFRPRIRHHARVLDRDPICAGAGNWTGEADRPTWAGRSASRPVPRRAARSQSPPHCGLIRPIWFALYSVNQSLPSGRVVMHVGLLWGLSSGAVSRIDGGGFRTHAGGGQHSQPTAGAPA
jgi:hypothetical protein